MSFEAILNRHVDQEDLVALQTELLLKLKGDYDFEDFIEYHVLLEDLTNVSLAHGLSGVVEIRLAGIEKPFEFMFSKKDTKLLNLGLLDEKNKKDHAEAVVDELVDALKKIVAVDGSVTYKIGETLSVVKTFEAVALASAGAGSASADTFADKLKKEITRLRLALEGQREDYEAMFQELNTEASLRVDTEGVLAEKTGRLNSLYRRVRLLNREVDNLKKDKGNVEATVAVLNGKIDGLQNQVKELNRALEKHTARIRALDAAKAAAEKARDEALKAHDEVLRAKPVDEAKVAATAREQALAEAQKSYESRIAGAVAKTEEHKAAFDALTKKYNAALADHAKGSAGASELTKRIEELTQAGAASAARVEELVAAEAASAAKVVALRAEAATLAERMEATSKQSLRVGLQVVNLREERDALAAQLAALKASPAPKASITILSRSAGAAGAAASSRDRASLEEALRKAQLEAGSSRAALLHVRGEQAAVVKHANDAEAALAEALARGEWMQAEIARLNEQLRFAGAAQADLTHRLNCEAERRTAEVAGLNTQLERLYAELGRRTAHAAAAPAPIMVPVHGPMPMMMSAPAGPVLVPVSGAMPPVPGMVSVPPGAVLMPVSGPRSAMSFYGAGVVPVPGYPSAYSHPGMPGSSS